MEKVEKVKFWITNAERDFVMVDKLFKNKDYMYCLFFGQLALEKLFKALYIKINDSAPPFVHDLAYLAGKCNLDADKILVDDLKEISGFNINARYDDYKNNFFNKADVVYTKKYLQKIKEVESWLIKEISKK